MASNFVVWFTGIPCSGKSTLARTLAYALVQRQVDARWLDGDETRKTFGRDLGFSPADRDVNIERVMGVASYLVHQGTNVICSYVSPYEARREKLRGLVDNSIIVWVNASPEVCAKRDVKGMWAKAKSGEIKGFTGYDAPFEEPVNYDLKLNTSELTLEECLHQLLEILQRKGLLCVS